MMVLVAGLCLSEVGVVNFFTSFVAIACLSDRLLPVNMMG